MVEPGTVVDGFVIGEPMHSGAMGNLFHVTRPGDPRRLVMKVPRGEPSEAVISFQTESTIVPALAGPHVPPFVAAGDLARTPYLVTEWIDGVSLEERIGRPLAIDEVVRIGAAIADALRSIHEQGVVHLDVKPDNIIVRHDGTAALVDFGFAHHARYPDLLAEERRFRAGSAAYLSPEQLLGNREDPRSDLFSLGVVLYEMATGALPFGEPDTDVRNRLWLDPIPPRAFVRGMPLWLQEIILRCLEPSADARYSSAADLAFDLRNPAAVVITERATKAVRAGLLGQLRRFLKAWQQYDRRLREAGAMVSRTPIVLVALDVTRLDEVTGPELRRAVAHLLSRVRYRVVCVSLMRDVSELHLDHLAALRRWSEPLRLRPNRLSLHAIQPSDAAAAVLEFAQTNDVDVIVLAVPGAGEADHHFWRTIASSVVANAGCTVHVIRVPAQHTVAEIVAASVDE